MLSQLRLFSNDNNGQAVLLSFVVAVAVAVAVAASCFRFLVAAAAVLISCACHTHTQRYSGTVAAASVGCGRPSVNRRQVKERKII